MQRLVSTNMVFPDTNATAITCDQLPTRTCFFVSMFSFHDHKHTWHVEQASLGHKSHKNSEIHIDVSHSRQPLVKGERLVRYEVNTVMI